VKRSTITVLLACTAVAVAAILAATAGSTSPPAAAKSRAAFAQHVQQTVGGLLTGLAQTAVAMVASGTREWSPAGVKSQVLASELRIRAATPGANVSSAGLANVRVNTPGEDTHFIDQTTQSETGIAVAGQSVVVGYNDSQTSIPGLLTAGLKLTGYSYSTDGGQTFTDAGVLPNGPGAEQPRRSLAGLGPQREHLLLQPRPRLRVRQPRRRGREVDGRR
jgi:hypothetical protein